MNKRGVFVLLSASLLCFLLSLLLWGNKERSIEIERLVIPFQESFFERERSADFLLNEVYFSFAEDQGFFLNNVDNVRQLNSLYYSEAEIVFITRSDSLLFLSHNVLPVNHYQLPEYASGMFHLQNGWYYIVSRSYQDYQIWVASLVKKDFRYQNRFLVNDFYETYNIPPFLEIAVNAALGWEVYDNDDNYVFSLVANQNEYTHSSGIIIFFAVLLSLAGFVLLGLVLFRGLKYFMEREKAWLGFLFLFSALVLIRLLVFIFKFPAVFYDSYLFSAHLYAASIYQPSLGDLLLNIFFLFFFLFLAFTYRSKLSFKFSSGPLFTVLTYTLGFLLIAFFSAYIVFQLQSLVFNSSLSLDVNFIFSMDIYNFLGFTIIGLLFLSFYFLSHTVFSIIHRNGNRKTQIIHAIATVFILCTLMYLIVSYFIIWLFLFLSCFLYFSYRPGSFKTISFTQLILSLFFFAVIGTYALYVFNLEKEFLKRTNVALRLAFEQDPVAEFLFSEFENDLYEDYGLQELVMRDPYNEESILQYLKTYYFIDFWARYDIQLTTCSPGEILFFKPIEAELLCHDYFTFYIDEFGRPTVSDHFIYLANNTGRNSYIAILPIIDNETNELRYNVYMEFEGKFIPRDMGFPELLVDEKVDLDKNLGNYSYAIYKNGNMTMKFGPYFYSVFSGFTAHSNELFHTYESEGYSHLVYNRDADTHIYVSKPVESMLERIAPFSYLFITFFLLSIIIWLSVLYLHKELHISFNFKKQLQFAIIVIVLISVVSIGGASAWFIFNIHGKKNEAFINEKAHSVLIELENLLAEEAYLNDSYSDYLHQVLMRLSQVFFTDINLFDPDGNLLASSRPRVFDEGLISAHIHPVAYNELRLTGKSLFVHNESIGNLDYISAYVPLMNINNRLMGYINLPYFAQQSELRNELSYFLVAFINIYLLLLLFSLIIAFFISNYLTRPLQIIRNSLSSISFGKSNKKISWEREDEIGQLISEYNRMIDELAISAELLASTERESAWREMAKQVAHEIKNPLTPMRLNVQYLHRAWQDKAEDWEERLERFTKTMVEHIDSLALIAGEFSDFAKMPSAKRELINLNEFLPEVMDLYKGFDVVSIDCYLPDNGNDLIVNADRKQLLRVFNNLIKNAIQAYEKNENVTVAIHCEKEENYVRIEVQDYGVGIPENVRKNIFQPYFTTKSSGMGLGLAMVKSIIEGSNGHISFYSEAGKGTSFVIRIPAVNEA